jgi:hypothetical protein
MDCGTPIPDRSIVLTSMQITPKQLTSTIALGITLLGLSHAPVAEAKQFKRLVQTGQTIPGNTQPLTEIIQPTIGSNGQVAVILRTQTVTSPGNVAFATKSTFQGIYTIGQTGQISLLQGNTSSIGYRTSQSNEFSAPTISQNQVGYLSLNQTSGGPNIIGPKNFANFQVGTPGNLTTLQARIILRNGLPISGESNAAFVNGNGYYRYQPYQGPNQVANDTDIFGVINGKPQVLLSGTDPVFEGIPLNRADNGKLRASSGLIVLTRTRNIGSIGDTTDVYERPIAGGTFKKLNSFLGASCGISVSQDNIVACFDTTTSQLPSENILTRSDITVRFGRQGTFTPLTVPGNNNSRQVSNPSISQKNVAFQVNDASAIASIYFSQNGQTPQKVVTTGDKLDGKTVKSVQLSESGRAIIDKSIVFTATFTDGVTALYRVDL